MPRTPLVPALVLTLAATPLLTVGATTPAEAKGRHKPTISITAIDPTPTAGDRLKFKGSVSGYSRGARVRLQEKQDGPWRVVADRKVRVSGRYRLATEAVAGSSTYRVKVTRTKHLRPAASPTVEVVGQEPPEQQLSSYPMGQLRRDLGQLIDDYREARGLDRWRQDAEMHDYAQEWSAEQAEQGRVLTRSSFEDAPELYDVVGEHTTLSGMPADVMADLEEDAGDLLSTDALWLGIGMGLRDDDTGYWTITVAIEEPGSLGPDAATEEAVRQKILEQTNAYRADHGLAPLALMDELNTVAQDWSRHMAANDVFHHNPSYSQQYPPGWRRAGENIAAGYAEDAVVDGWYASPGHKANMLGDFTHIGIGFATHPDSKYGRYYTQNFARY